MVCIHLATIGAITAVRDGSYTAKVGPKTGQLIPQHEANIIGVGEDGKPAIVRVSAPSVAEVENKLKPYKVGQKAIIPIWGESSKGTTTARAT